MRRLFGISSFCAVGIAVASVTGWASAGSAAEPAARPPAQPPTARALCEGADFTSATASLPRLTVTGTPDVRIGRHGDDLVYFPGSIVLRMAAGGGRGWGGAQTARFEPLPAITTCGYTPPAPPSGEPPATYAARARFDQGSTVVADGHVTVDFAAGVHMHDGASACLRVFAGHMVPVTPTVCGTLDASTDSFTPTTTSPSLPLGAVGAPVLGVLVFGGFALEQARRRSRLRAAGTNTGSPA